MGYPKDECAPLALRRGDLDLTSVIFSILVIGVVGMMLDAAFAALQRGVAYAE